MNELAKIARSKIGPCKRPAAITQVDAVLCEDGSTVLFLGHCADPDTTFVASLTLPLPIDETAFDADEWRQVGGLRWRRA